MRRGEMMTTKQNIKDAKAIVATWPKWKIDNMMLAFSEKPPKIPVDK